MMRKQKKEVRNRLNLEAGAGGMEDGASDKPVYVHNENGGA